ncbi:late histone H2B.L4-like [Uloborus diversus]|uniref:late histone H2B.L4-like n=1 Tax=Uloborus diversus TaxID=327109 RepID=UPI00240905D6|nr:late histone H2B.L4-like [Uloborus diversus]
MPPRFRGKFGWDKPFPPPEKKRRRKRKETFSIYLYRILKTIHDDLSISSKAMNVMNCFILDIFERIATEASRLAAYGKRQTINSADIRAAVLLLLTGDLQKHAEWEGAEALKRYHCNKKTAMQNAQVI